MNISLLPYLDFRGEFSSLQRDDHLKTFRKVSSMSDTTIIPPDLLLLGKGALLSSETARQLAWCSL